MSVGGTSERRSVWKKRAICVAGGAAIAGVAVVVTLAATRREAQRQNLIANLRGQLQGLSQGGWSEGWTAAEEWYREHGFDQLAERAA